MYFSGLSAEVVTISPEILYPIIFDFESKNSFPSLVFRRIIVFTIRLGEAPFAFGIPVPSPLLYHLPVLGSIHLALKLFHLTSSKLVSLVHCIFPSLSANWPL